MSERRVFDLDEGWGEMAAGIENLKAILEGDESRKIDRELWINLYTYAFRLLKLVMCGYACNVPRSH